MTFPHAPWLVFTVVGLTSAWLALLAYFLHYTKKYQPAEFTALGEPAFNNSGFRIISYVFKRGHRSLGDRRYSLLCDVMLVCFTALIAFASYAFGGYGD